MKKTLDSFVALPPLSGVAGLIPVLAGAFIFIWSIVIFMLGNNFSLADDGLIYLRYAHNLANGNGLVYNPGEYYESNTNFLWSILLVPAHWIDLEPTLYLRALGVAIGAGVAWLTYKLTERIEDSTAALLVVVLLCMHHTFFIIPNSGFAPHLVTLFALAVIYKSFDMEKSPTLANGAAVAALMSLLLLTRLDASLIFGVVWLLAMFAAKPHKNPRYAAAVGAAPLVVFGLYLLWKLQYYGDIFPAPYYAKAGPAVPDYYDFTQRGLWYLRIYFTEYGFVFLAPFIIYGIRWRFSSYASFSMKSMTRVACVALVLVWCGYMVKVGGGYVGFRFMATIAPFLFMAIISVLWFAKFAALAGAAVLLIGSANYSINFKGLNVQGIDLRKQHFQTQGQAKLKTIGLSLRETFSEFGEYSTSVKIATILGGYLPFYSKLFTMEMWGWTDPRISLPENHVVRVDYKPGHNWTVSPEFMVKEGINLAFGYPHTIPKAARNEEVFHASKTGQLIAALSEAYQQMGNYNYPDDMQFVRLPVDEETDIVALYLVRSAELDEFFARKGYYVHDAAF